MEYAVVSFLNELIEEENVVSEVPLIWLHTNNTMCKWPPKHEGHHILKYSVSKPDWTDHPVRCERICGSREEARKKCIRNPQDESSTASEVDMGRKSRKKQPSKFLVNYYTGCPSPPHLDDDTDNEDSEHFSREAGHNPYMGVSGDLPEATQDLALPEVEEVLVYQELTPPTQPPDMANAEIQPVADNRPIVFNRGSE